MTVKGTFTVELSGPYEQRDALLRELAGASIAAQYIAPSAEGPDEEAKGWVRAEFHEGTESPGADFQRACLDKTTALGARFGYELRSHGIVVSGASDLRHIVDKRTGKVLMKGFGFPPNAVRLFAEETGIPLEYLELREPPGMWDVPEA
jgi:hypothetical protein